MRRIRRCRSNVSNAAVTVLRETFKQPARVRVEGSMEPDARMPWCIASLKIVPICACSGILAVLSIRIGNENKVRRRKVVLFLLKVDLSTGCHFDLSCVGGDYMISGGNVTVMISDMDVAVAFYTEVLGLKLTNRFGNHWATVQAGKSLVIGLHPASPKHPAPGTRGSMLIGIEIDERIEDVVERMQRKGVRFTGPIIKDGPGCFADFVDPDGNPLYLWEMSLPGTADPTLTHASA